MSLGLPGEITFCGHFSGEDKQEVLAWLANRSRGPMTIAATTPPESRAKHLLRKYFELSLNGLDPENEAEIDELVEALLAAAHLRSSAPDTHAVGGPGGNIATNGASGGDVPPGVKFSEWLLKRPGSHSQAEHIGKSVGITAPVRDWTEEQCKVVAAIFKRPRTDEQVDREARGRPVVAAETYATDEGPPPPPVSRPPTPSPEDCPIKDGRGLFRFLKDMERDHGVNVLQWVDKVWGKGKGYDWKMTDWSPSQVAEAYAAAQRKLAEVAGPKPLFDVPDEPPPAPERPSVDDPRVPELRERLKADVHKIAKAVHGKVDGGTIAAVLQSLKDEHPANKAIYAMATCSDPVLMGEYLRITAERCRDIDSFSGPSLLREPTAAELLFDETEAPRE